MPGDMTLLAYIRRIQGLKGTKEGCGRGQCGTCTVLINGSPEKSCVIKLKSGKLKGADIQTIEGLTTAGGQLHPVQTAFVNAGAIQCGFCTPGMILTIKSLLDLNPSPSRQEIRDYISPRNICRCTGYRKIFDAVEEAAGMIRGEPALFPGFEDDAPMRRREGIEKAAGRLKYADDIEWENMLHGKVLFAEEPHAILTSLQTESLLSLPGVAGIITAEDIPGSRNIGMVYRDQPALIGTGDEILSLADPICAVFAESPEQAESALHAVEAEYKILPGVYTMEEAEQPDAPLVHPDKPGNIFYQGSIERGNVEEELKASAVVVQGVFSTSRVAHGFMEPESGLARPDGTGGVEILYPTQTVFDDQAQVSEVLDLPREKIRVIQLPTGGAFGGKEDVIFHHILALAALKFNRPVKITLNRKESLRVSQKKHTARFAARLGVTRDGRFRALSAVIKADKGAYAALGFDIIENMMSFIGGPYYIPAVEIKGRSIYTHNVMAGAMRGFGANQSNFVIESLVDMAARETGIDPFQIRLKNALKPGLPTVTDHVLEPGIPGIVEVIEAVREAVAKEDPPEAPENTILGFGFACGVKNVGYGHSLPESAGTKVELCSDGTCRLYVSHHEYGQGAAIGQARIASEVLGIPIDCIEYHGPDTGETPFTGASTASRQTFLSGNATLGACGRLRSDLFELASARMGVLDPASLSLKGNSIVTKDGEKKMPLSELGENFTAEYRTIAPGTDGFLEEGRKSGYGSPDFKSRRTHWAYAYGAQAAWVAVEPDSGKTRVLKIITAGDVGRVLNRRAVEGQQEGGVVMGVGYALSEEFNVEQGRNLTVSLNQCGIPRAGDAPDIVTIAVEVPHPWGPLGVKGLAEAPSLATAPATANAIYNAVGARMHELPMKPERIQAALRRVREHTL